LTVGDVQRAVSSGMGGENIATTVEGRERYSINVRYLADYRNDLNALRRILIMTPTGAQLPLGEVARISLSPGPSMIRDEDGLLTGSSMLTSRHRTTAATLAKPSGCSIGSCI
jgi:Cu(I)/Ag(I) efflux system membrane protein CusA/SilA